MNSVYSHRALVVSDRDTAAACIAFARDHKMIIEAVCGAALASVYNGKLRETLPYLTLDSTVVVIVSGSTAVTWDLFQNYSELFDIPL